MAGASNRVRRLVLRPGLRVLRRGRTQWQVGIDPASARVLPSSPATDRVLQLLERGEMFEEDLEPESLAALGALDDLLWDPRRTGPDHLAPGDRAALALRDPARLEQRVAHRQAARIGVLGEWPADPEPLFSAAGLRVQVDNDPTVVLLLSLGEPNRERLDPLVRDGIPHLVVRLVEGVVTLGPFVLPGSTACLRCIDAHQSVGDPLWPTMVDRHAHACGHPRPDGIAEPVDSALITLALAWAVRDVVTHCEGDRPTTWSATVRISPGLSAITDLQWLRHPACGCGWPGTMEA